jgi:hypothetical protein
MTNAIFNPNGSEYIASLIAAAVADESRTATVSGNWTIDSEVRIPSNFTLILEDCHLRLAYGSYTNIFVNEHHDTELGRTVAGRDRNITIIGRGEAILDGGEYNGLSERNHSKDGLPPIWKNNLVLFTNVEGFKVEGLICRNQRWWALNFIYCAHGYIGNIDFCANDTAIDADGNVYHGLLHDRYAEVLVKNADGVDLRRGCHDIVIENITGFTEDDTVALTGLYGRLEKQFEVDGLSIDIYNVTIRNIASASFCTNVRLLNQGEVKLHDILIDGVYDTSDESPYMDIGKHTVRVGDVKLYGTRHATKEETYNITIRNVRSRAPHAIALAGEMDGLVMYGIECFDGAKMLLDNRGVKENQV